MPGKDYRSFHILCECGSIVQRNCMTKHQITKKHTEIMKENQEE